MHSTENIVVVRLIKELIGYNRFSVRAALSSFLLPIHTLPQINGDFSLENNLIFRCCRDRGGKKGELYSFL